MDITKEELKAKLGLGVIANMGPMPGDKFNEILLEILKEEKLRFNIWMRINPFTPNRQNCVLYNGPSVIPEVNRQIEELEKIGVRLICFPCNTIHYFHQELSKNKNIYILNMIRETVLYILKENPNPKIGLLASRGAIKARIFHDIFEEMNMNYETPTEEDQSKYTDIVIHGTPTGEVTEDGKIIRNNDGVSSCVVTQSQALLLEKQLQILSEKGIDTVIYGCTELPFHHDYLQKNFPLIKFVDPMRVLAERSVEILRVCCDLIEEGYSGDEDFEVSKEFEDDRELGKFIIKGLI